MQIRTEKIILLSVYTDRILSLSFLKVITNNQIESIKLPTNIDNYRLQHLLRPNYLLEVELVKTRKNWILKNILAHDIICSLKDYNDHTKFAQIIYLLNKYSQEGQDINLIPFLVNHFNENPICNLDIVNFESQLLEQLGFTPKISGVDQLLQLNWAKASSGLI